MSDPDNDPSIVPPAAVPVIPLNYSHGLGATSTFGQQAARASYVAPLVAVVLGILTGPFRESAPMLSVGIGALNILLILGGFVLGIVALMGMGRWGRDKVLVPAIMGVTVGALLIAAIVAILPSIARARNAAAAQQIAAASAAQRAQAAQLRKEGEAAFFADAWLGTYNTGGMIIAIAVMPADSPSASALNEFLPRPHPFAVVSVQNGTANSIELDTRNTVLYFHNGSHVRGINPLDILNTVTKDRESALRTFAPPYSVDAGKELTQGIYFFPDDIDFRQLERIALQVNGNAISIGGRTVTAEEKRKLYELGMQKKKNAG